MTLAVDPRTGTFNMMVELQTHLFQAPGFHPFPPIALPPVPQTKLISLGEIRRCQASTEQHTRIVLQGHWCRQTAPRYRSTSKSSMADMDRSLEDSVDEQWVQPPWVLELGLLGCGGSELWWGWTRRQSEWREAFGERKYVRRKEVWEGLWVRTFIVRLLDHGTGSRKRWLSFVWHARAEGALRTDMSITPSGGCNINSLSGCSATGQGCGVKPGQGTDNEMDVEVLVMEDGVVLPQHVR